MNIEKNINISRACINDFLAIAELDRVAWGENRNSTFIPDGEHIWRLWVEHALTVVARVNADIVGAGVAIPTVDPKLYYVHKIMFADNFKGQGLGTRLLSTMTESFDSDRVYSMLSTDPVNIPMQRVSEKCGFNEREFYPGYYRPNEDRWIYRRAPRCLNE